MRLLDLPREEALSVITSELGVSRERAAFILSIETGRIPGDVWRETPGANASDKLSNPFSLIDLHLPGKHNQRSHGRRRVGDIDEALDRLGQGKQVILDQPSQVSTLLDKLAKRVKEAEAKGDKAPNINLCDVSVPGTNIFCAGNKGIGRANMPQLKGKVKPGSKGARIANDKGKVDLGEAFAEHLRRSGVGVRHDEVSASHLRATQDELVGAKVAGMAAFLRDGGKMAGSIFVSKDDYVVDGHHRWAAQVGVEYGGQDFKLPIERVDMPILEVLQEARKFADGWGIEQKGFTGFQGSAASGSDLAYNPDQPRDTRGRWLGKGSGSGEGSSELASQLKNGLQMMAGFQPKPEGWSYANFQDLVLKEGDTFTEHSPEKIKMGPIKQCYANASRLADERPDLSYHEGYVTTSKLPGGLPIDHAWTVNESGQVVDNTLRVDEGEKTAYVGVAIPDSLRYSTQLETGVYGVFDYRNAERLLSQPWSPS